MNLPLQKSVLSFPIFLSSDSLVFPNSLLCNRVVEFEAFEAAGKRMEKSQVKTTLLLRAFRLRFTDQESRKSKLINKTSRTVRTQSGLRYSSLKLGSAMQLDHQERSHRRIF
jgi:hypothetical protein